MHLTDKQCKALKPKSKPYKKADGDGLYLLVKANGSKCWRMNYRFQGKQKTLAIGVYPEVSLKAARGERAKAKSQLGEGIDPAREKKKARLYSRVTPENTFQAIALEWYEQRKNTLSKNHARQVRNTLANDINPYIGDLPISEIRPAELLEALRSIEARGALDMARKALGSCGQVFRYAIACGKTERDISVDLKGALKTRKVQHRPYLTEDELPEFFQRLNDYQGDIVTSLALKFTILTLVRTKETRGALWNELHSTKSEWSIPPERMKMNSRHVVPFSKQAMSVLDKLRSITGKSDFIFPNSQNMGKCMSENTMLYAMYRMGYHGRATVHGFRGTASTILNEHGFRPDVIERQLAHVERNKVRAAYNHAEYLSERREMMQWWADHLEKLGLTL